MEKINSRNLDRIILKNMKFYAYHGALPQERVQGQYFIIDVEICVDLLLACDSDKLEDTISYAEVYSDIEKINKDNKFMLIEKLAGNIAQTILDKYEPVRQIKVLVKKPQAPINGIFDWMGVEIERTKQVNVYLSIGSNIGDRVENIQHAIAEICKLDNTYIVKQSKVYETDPVGYIEQDKFLNMVVMIKTQLHPLELLEKLQDIEKVLKRERLIRWGPRTIDLDILLYGNIVMNNPKLVIPHPEMRKRAFVLIPLKDIEPDINFEGKSIDFYIKSCNDKETVVLRKDIKIN